jgi:putative transposase
MSTAWYYPTDVSAEQWDVLQRLLPKPTWPPGGPGRKPMDLRRVLNGICYGNKTGCQGRMRPQNLGNGPALYGYFRRWRREGIWAQVLATLRQWARQS